MGNDKNENLILLRACLLKSAYDNLRQVFAELEYRRVETGSKLDFQTTRTCGLQACGS